MTLPTRQIYFNHCDSKWGIPTGIEGAACFSYLGRLDSGGLLGADRVLAAGSHAGQGQLPARRQGDFSACLTKGLLLLFLSSWEDWVHMIYIYVAANTQLSSHVHILVFILSCKFLKIHVFHGQDKLFLVCNHGNYRNKLSLKYYFNIINLDLIKACDVNKHSLQIF